MAFSIAGLWFSKAGPAGMLGQGCLWKFPLWELVVATGGHIFWHLAVAMVCDAQASFAVQV